MSTFSGGIGREEEDGAGWEGLIPTAEERNRDPRFWLVVDTLLDKKQDHRKCGGMETARELLRYWMSDAYLNDGMTMETAVRDIRSLARIFNA